MCVRCAQGDREWASMLNRFNFDCDSLLAVLVRPNAAGTGAVQPVATRKGGDAQDGPSEETDT